MRLLFGFLAMIAAIIVVVLLMVGLLRGDGSQLANQITTTVNLKEDKSVDGVVRYSLMSPIVADENFRVLRITISKNTRTLEVLQGYGRAQEKLHVLPNSTESYKAFLGALDAADFSQNRENNQYDPRNTCVTGNKAFYEMQLDNKKVVDTWASSCSSAQGNFAGNTEAVSRLFRAQIPDIDRLLIGISI